MQIFLAALSRTAHMHPTNAVFVAFLELTAIIEGILVKA